MKIWPLLLLFFLQLLAVKGQIVINTDIDSPIERHNLSNFSTISQGITIGPLEIGNHYRIEIPDAINHSGNLIELQSGASEVSSGNFFWEAYALSRYITFTTTYDAAQELIIANMSKFNAAQHTATSDLQSASPIQVGISNDPRLLVRSILHGLDCFETSNHNYSGFYGAFGSITEDISQMGVFNNGLAATGIEDGVILSTGRVSNAEGPNTFTGTTQIFNTTSSDPDLIQLAGTNQLFDVVILEFDFTPTTDYINFDYIFASEEYCEAVNNTNVDVFGFFVSGPGINGPYSNNAINIAVLPNGEPINVNTINEDSDHFPEYYQSNIPASFGEPCQVSPPVAPDDIEFDGYTTRLTAHADVISCETYHLKMIIADVGDTFYDSAIMLAAGSFSAGLVNVSEPSVTAEDGGLANAPLEGCSDGQVVFSRLDSSDINQDLTIYFAISPTSTATFGEDYTMPRDSFVIEAGEFSDTLTVEVFEDNIPEGTETIILRLSNTCNCDANTTRFFITDPPSMSLSLPDVDTICQNTSTTVSPIVSDGVGDYTYNWSSGSSDSTLSIAPFVGDSLFVVSVTDNCQQTAIDSIVVSAIDVKATIRDNAFFSLCNAGSEATVPIALSGAQSYSVVVSENGVQNTYNTTDDTLFLSFNSPTEITLVSVHANGCEGVANGTASITAPYFGLNPNTQNVSCFGENTGAFDIQLERGNTNYSITWADPSIQGFNPQNLAAGDYSLRLTDASGCELDTMLSISQPTTALNLDYRSSSPQTCTEMATAEVAANGGIPPYAFDWGDTGATTANRTDLNGGQTYTVSVTDANGCVATQDITTQDDRISLDASISSPTDELTCSQTSLILSAPTNNATVNYEWSDENGTVLGTQSTLNISQPGTYSLLVTEPNSGCSSRDNIVINISGDFIQLNTGGPYLLTCANDNISLTAAPVNFNGAVTYRWTNENATVTLGNSSTLDNVSTPGLYQVFATRDDNGCVSDAMVIVTEDKTRPSFDLSTTSISCYSDTATSSVQNPTAAYSYQWSTNGGNIISSTDQLSIQVDQVGTYDLVATNPDNGCTLDTFVNVSETRDELTPLAGDDFLLPCNTAGFQHSGSASPLLPGTTFKWYNQDRVVISETATFVPRIAGTYTLEVTHPQSGCTSTDNLTVTQEGPNSIDFRLRPAPCEEVGALININRIEGGDAPYTFMIDDNIVTLNNRNQIENVSEGSHVLTTIDARGCELYTDILVFAPDRFTGSAEDISISLGEDAQLGFTTNRDNAIVSIQWTSSTDLNCLSCTTPTATLPLESFAAQVNLIDSSGCELQLIQQVFVDRRDLVYAPNAFSPNNRDGINDKFILYGDQRFVNNIDYLRVFDRWGEFLWEGRDLTPGNIQEGWDGQRNGKVFNAGTFVFTAQVSYFDGSQEIISGTINIVE